MHYSNRDIANLLHRAAGIVNAANRDKPSDVSAIYSNTAHEATAMAQQLGSLPVPVSLTVELIPNGEPDTQLLVGVDALCRQFSSSFDMKREAVKAVLEYVLNKYS